VGASLSYAGRTAILLEIDIVCVVRNTVAMLFIKDLQLKRNIPFN